MHSRCTTGVRAERGDEGRLGSRQIKAGGGESQRRAFSRGQQVHA